MHTRNIRIISLQRGSALLVSLVFLVILTVLGLSVMNTSHLEMKMAANAQFGNQAFQAAESAIDSVMRIPKPTLLTFVGGAPTARNYFFNQTTAVGFPDGSQFFAETAATLTTFQQTGNVPGGGFSVSEDAGTPKAHHFTIESTGQSQRAGRSAHEQGMYVIGL